jgi:hypothetical protein
VHVSQMFATVSCAVAADAGLLIWTAVHAECRAQNCCVFRSSKQHMSTAHYHPAATVTLDQLPPNRVLPFSSVPFSCLLAFVCRILYMR